jgi:EAL domain-containing protein (putative c-di-GMP-specific phosphodiesterase class I)
MRVTAEGVENEQQAAILAGLGCTEVQGFLYSRPIPASELEKKDPATPRLGSNILSLRRRA